MMKKASIISITVLALITFNASYSANLEQTIIVSQAGSALCKNYGDELNQNTENFSEMNLSALAVARSVGLTDNLQKYLATVESLKKEMHNQLINQYGSKNKVFYDWCPRLYKGYQNGVNKGNSYN